MASNRIVKEFEAAKTEKTRPSHVWGTRYLGQTNDPNPLETIPLLSLKAFYMHLINLGVNEKILNALRKQEIVCELTQMCATCETPLDKEGESRSSRYDKEFVGPRTAFSCSDCWINSKSILDFALHQIYKELCEEAKSRG